MTRSGIGRSSFLLTLALIIGAAVWAQEAGKWDEMQLPVLAKVWSLKAVAFADPSVGWAVGSINDSNYGLVLKYEEGGWKKVFTPAGTKLWVTHLVDIALSGPQDGWAVGDKYYIWSDPDRFKGFVAKLQNGRWSQGSLPGGGRNFKLEGVSIAPKSDVAWAVGGVIQGKTRHGLILQNTGPWRVVNVPDPDGSEWELKDVDCPAADRCWAVGRLVNPPKGKNPLLVMSYRNGEWKREQTPMPPAEVIGSKLQCVSFAGPEIGWAGGKGVMLIYRGGKWEKDAPNNVQAAWQINGLSCSRPDYCYAVGLDMDTRTPLWLERTSQGWRKVKTSFDAKINALDDVFFLKPGLGWAVGGLQVGQDYPAGAFQCGSGK